MTTPPSPPDADTRAGTVPAYALAPDVVLERLDSGPGGLSAIEAARRLRRVGPNVLPSTPPVPALRILLQQLRSLVVLLLMAAGAVSLAVGEGLDAAAIGAVLVINTVLGFFTELRARRSMEALVRLQSPRCTVLRDGELHEIDARGVVPGDVIDVESGQLLSADARLLDARELTVNESALTGESFPARKAVPSVPADAVLAERKSMLYTGTLALTGHARAVVVATGVDTELGHIGALVGGIAEERSPMERRLDALGGNLVWIALGAGFVFTVLGLLRGEPLGRMLEAGIALAIAAVPEGLPAVATVALAVSVRRMARRNALVRRLSSVDTLGAVTLVCTDKTGTLTAGEMTVRVLLLPDRRVDVGGVGYGPDGRLTISGEAVMAAADPALARALRIAVLANRAAVVRTGSGDWEVRGDPTEAALLVAARKAGIERAELAAQWPESGEVPFSSERLLMATFNRSPDGALIAHVKGAPDRVLERCTRVLTAEGERPLGSVERARLLEASRSLGDDGLRVLALASGPCEEAGEAALRDLTFVGLAGMMDPPAPGVAATIQALQGAGIHTVMITGDQRSTAAAVARELGILGADGTVLDGPEIQDMDDGALDDRLGAVAAFSRVSPAEKLRLIGAYQRTGHVLAMLGDGVNDAAALKQADVGVAMGRRGTDAAKEAAEIVLQDDRFQTIAAAVEGGRVISDNIRKFVFYLFSCNLAEILVLLIAAAAGPRLPLTPLQILWLNLVTDTFPALALALEPAEPDVMRRAPVAPGQGILSARFLRAIGLYGVLITVATLVAFALGLTHGGPVRAVTMSFSTLALAQVFHLVNARTRGPTLGARRILDNPYAVGAMVLVALLQIGAVEVPLLQLVLGTGPLTAGDWLSVVLLGLVPAVAGQLLKRYRGTA